MALFCINLLLVDFKDMLTRCTLFPFLIYRFLVWNNLNMEREVAILIFIVVLFCNVP